MRRVKYLFVALVVVAALLFTGCGKDDAVVVFISGKYLYVNTDSTNNFVSAFIINRDGTLTELPGSPYATGGLSAGGFYSANRIALARGKGLLFASNVTDSTITVFRINRLNGTLTQIGLPIASGGDMGSGGSLAVDNRGRFLFAGNDNTANISVFAIGADGSLTPVSGSPFAFGASINGITLNVANDLLYVADGGTNAFIVLAIAADGSLAPIAGSPFAYTAGFTLTSFAFSSATLGIAGATGGAYSSYAVDAAGVPTLLATLVIGANNQAISTARNGSLAILSGGNSNQIGVVTVADDGTLTQVAGSPFVTAAPVRGYAAANPRGTFLFATESDRIEAFAVDPDGVLTSLGTFLLNNTGDPKARSLVIY